LQLHDFVKSPGDIADERKCVVRVLRSRSLDLLSFDLGNAGSIHGVAFPEVLRAYSRLFSEAADRIEIGVLSETPSAKEKREYNELMGVGVPS
jgi:hypothetical protein